MENGRESPGETAEERQGLIAPFLAGHQDPITSTSCFSRHPDYENQALPKTGDSLRKVTKR